MHFAPRNLIQISLLKESSDVKWRHLKLLPSPACTSYSPSKKVFLSSVLHDSHCRLTFFPSSFSPAAELRFLAADLEFPAGLLGGIPDVPPVVVPPLSAPAKTQTWPEWTLKPKKIHGQGQGKNSDFPPSPLYQFFSRYFTWNIISNSKNQREGFNGLGFVPWEIRQVSKNIPKQPPEDNMLSDACTPICSAVVTSQLKRTSEQCQRLMRAIKQTNGHENIHMSYPWLWSLSHCLCSNCGNKRVERCLLQFIVTMDQHP